MEDMGKKKPRPRRSFTPQLKTDIVERCRRGDRTVGQVAKDFDLTETAVRDWVKQAQVDAAHLQQGRAVSDSTIREAVDGLPDQIPLQAPVGLTRATIPRNHVAEKFEQYGQPFYAQSSHLKPGRSTALGATGASSPRRAAGGHHHPNRVTTCRACGSFTWEDVFLPCPGS